MLRVNPLAASRSRSCRTGGVQESVVVYGAGANQVPVLQACQRRGWRVIAVDRNPHAPGAELADRFVHASLRDHAGIQHALESEEFRGVIARLTDHEALESSRRLAEDRGLAAPCSDLLAASTSKVTLGEICRTRNLPTPLRWSGEESVAFEQGPVMLRPDIPVRGKAGIHRVDSAESLVSRSAQAAAASANGKIDISSWIAGADVSVLAQLDRGKGRRLVVWDEWVAVTSTGGIVGLGCGMPSLFSRKLIEIDRVVDAVAGCFSGSRCLVALSLRIDETGQPFIIEIHLGIGGDSIADVLIPAALPGVDVFDSLVCAHSGAICSHPEIDPLPRALLRGSEGWRLIEAPDVESLRMLACRSAPDGVELPFSLTEGGFR